VSTCGPLASNVPIAAVSAVLSTRAQDSLLANTALLSNNAKTPLSSAVSYSITNTEHLFLYAVHDIYIYVCMDI
jgi:hypothetical protein